MQRIVDLLYRHWGKALFLALIAGAGIALAVNGRLRAQAHEGWHRALSWAGLVQQTGASDQLYWCPMHPQIKRTQPNETCPICNMALVPLEGDATGAPLDRLTLTPQQMQQAGVVFEPVIRRKLYREIDTTGRVEYDERRLAKITSWVRGKSRIEKLHVNFTGTRVEKGELMAELYSPELIVAQEEYVTGKREKSFVSPSLTRQKLLDQGLTPEQIEELGRSGKVQDRIPVYAPFAGTVIERKVEQGDYVSEGTALFRLADLTHLWIFADIYEDELPLVQIGQKAEIHVRGLPGKTFEGTVAFIDPELQRATRTVRLRIHVENQDGLLKPGSFARVMLRKEMGEQLAIPANAVLRSGQRAVAIVRLSEGTFQPREIQLDRTWAYPSEVLYRPGGRLDFGAERVRYHPVLAGLHPGDKVVAAGAFLLNAESQFQSVLTKMLPPLSERLTLEETIGSELAKAVRDVLQAYYDLSATLADDDLGSVPKQGKALERTAAALAEAVRRANLAGPTTHAQQLVKLARGVHTESMADLRQARTAFGKISRTLVTLLSETGGQTLFGTELFYFRCGMAEVGYENWLWWSPETHNPYMGKKMLQCGSQLKELKP